ncbi:MAG: zinc ribbon domain-containing protein [Clostridia bacterium]|nr:zinc ribbon domain-containing protein [Clostridia bacterium]
MGFMDKLKEAGQKVADTSKDLTAKAGKSASNAKTNFELSNKISKNEKLIKDTIAQIGMTLFTNEPDFCTQKCPDLVEIIKKAQEEIAADKKAQEDLKKVCQCPSCGKEIDEGTKFCIFCGAAIDAAPAEVAPAEVAPATEAAPAENTEA